MENIGYNGKFFNNKDFRIKIKTGADINNATGNAIVGEMFLVTGESPALYIATETSTENSYAIHKVMDLTGGAVSSGSSDLIVEAEGSVIVGFSLQAKKENVLTGNVYTTETKQLTLTSENLAAIQSISPNSIVIKSTASSTSEETGESIEFEFEYPYDSGRFASGKIVANVLSSLKAALAKEGVANVATKIQNAFGFNIDEYIKSSGEDKRAKEATGELSNASEALRRILGSAIAAQNTTGATFTEVIDSIAQEIDDETTARPSVEDFFDKKLSKIVEKSLKKGKSLAPESSLDAADQAKVDNLTKNIKTTIDKDIDKTKKGFDYPVGKAIKDIVHRVPLFLKRIV